MLYDHNPLRAAALLQSDWPQGRLVACVYSLQTNFPADFAAYLFSLVVGKRQAHTFVGRSHGCRAAVPRNMMCTPIPSNEAADFKSIVDAVVRSQSLISWCTTSRTAAMDKQLNVKTRCSPPGSAQAGDDIDRGVSVTATLHRPKELVESAAWISSFI